MTEVKAKCLYVNRRWEDLDADHRRGAGRGAGKGVLSAQRGDTLPKYLNTHPHRETDSTCAKGYQLTAHGPYLAHRSFASFCFWSVHLVFGEAVANI